MQHVVRAVLGPAAAVAFMVGCQTPTPPAIPVPADVAAEADALTHAQLANQPTAYVKVGYEIVERECGTFFDSLDRAEDRALFASKELNLAGTAAAGILGALKAGATPITIAGVAFPLAANTVANYQTNLLITPYPDETYNLVKAALKTYRDNAGTPLDIYDAVSLVQNYAAICTYSGIHSLAKQALAIAKTTTQVPTVTLAPPAQRLYRAPPAARFRPLIPNVVIAPSP